MSNNIPKIIFAAAVFIGGGTVILINYLHIDNFTSQAITDKEDTALIRIEPSLGEDEDIVRSRHPACFSENMFINEAESSEEDGLNILNYKDILNYSLLGKNVTNSVRYNHLCPWMKPRYNCAKSKTQAYGQSPVDWKLTLQDGSEQCVLWDLVHDLGGPIGVGERLLLQRRHSKAKEENDEDESLNERPFTVAMFGNSYLRQIFEALKCSWSNDITYTVMQKGARYKYLLQD